MGNLECPTSAHLDLESTERLARPRAGPAQPLGERRARHHPDFRCRALHFASRRFTFEARHHPDRMGSRWGDATIS